VSEDEIEALYKSLFETSLRTEALSHLENPGHIASVIFFLNDVIQNHRRDPTGTMVSTETSGCKGVNGSYFLKSSPGEPVWVFKPRDEETYPLGIGIPRGGGTVREHFATIVNDDGIYPIPFTAHVILFGKEGSVQRVVPGKSLRVLEEEEKYPPEGKDDAPMQAVASDVIASISARQMQAKLIFDLIFGNGDGHEGNIMCAPSSFYSIDHGNICSTSDQAVLCIPYVRLLKSTEPLAPDLLAYCRDLPIGKYRDLMRRFGFDEAAITCMEMRANWLIYALSRGLTIQEAAIPLALKTSQLIYQKKVDLPPLAEAIYSLRIELHALCSREKWGELKAVLTTLRGGGRIPDLIRGEDHFRQLWSMYLKHLLAEYPSAKMFQTQIGASVS
jgi:hypothetical protein